MISHGNTSIGTPACPGGAAWQNPHFSPGKIHEAFDRALVTANVNLKGKVSTFFTGRVITDGTISDLTTGRKWVIFRHALYFTLQPLFTEMTPFTLLPGLPL